MKLEELRKLIKEELASVLKENAPEEEKKTIEKEITPTKPQPRRKVGREDIPKESPTPAKALTSLKETEKELVSKITARFLKSKK